MSNTSNAGIVWLASYPKSGNTWLRLALASLRAGGAPVDLTAQRPEAPIASSRRLFDTLLEVESSDLTADEIEELRPRVYEILNETSQKPLLCKVHDAWTLTRVGEPLFPLKTTRGTIYVVRDPRDVAISYAHHSGITVNSVIELMAEPNFEVVAGERNQSRHLSQRFLSWSAHVESWLDASNLKPLLVRYEDMLADSHAVLARISDYLGWKVADEALTLAVAATRFEVLQAAEDRQGFHEKPAADKRFFRRGVAGGWCDTLTQAQAKRIEQDHAAVMARLGYLPGD